VFTIVLVHNHYQQSGGEDQVFAAETALLEAYGHRVLRYTVHNDQAANLNSLTLASSTVWNGEVYRELRALIRKEQPQVVHFHNTFPLISPAAPHAAKAEGVPVVQTLHNYRLLCPNALFFRNGGVCEDCLGKSIPWPGVAHACYRESRAASGVVAGMLTVHRALDTWRRSVDAFIVLTGFARQKFIQGGLWPEKVIVKPNFVHPDPGSGSGQGGYGLFIGRLSPEKGVNTLLAAWEKRGHHNIPLKIVGDGPLAGRVAKATQNLKNVVLLGRQTKDQVLALMKNARVLLFPSRCYEGLPMAIVEAYAVGLPVIASDLGGMSSLVEHGRTGLHFRPGDSEDLAEQVKWVLSNPAKLARMRWEARAEFEATYTAEENYQRLMQIYELAATGAST
jgi:glycosyltransferase involved in cell wall biosynthesis